MTFAATTSKFDAGELTVLLPRLELTPEAAACIDGCATVSEAMRLLAKGFGLLKFFPAEAAAAED